MKHRKVYITKSATETQKLGEKLAQEILDARRPSTRAVVLALEGDLGAGKTTFLQGFAEGLGIKEKILSPTFIIMKKFQIQKNAYKKGLYNKRRPSFIVHRYFYHIDCYRVKNEKNLGMLGFKEIISDPKNIVAIEWPERIKKVLPKNKIKITFDHQKENHRTLTIREYYDSVSVGSQPQHSTKGEGL